MCSDQSTADFYQRNTSLFLRLGGGRATGSIHRPLWGEGVTSVDEALEYAYRLVAECLETGEAARSSVDCDRGLRVLDIGCGVGGGVIYLAARFGKRISATGVTVSTRQVELARATAAARALDDRCTFLLADFLSLPLLEPFDLAYSIEAFVHGDDPERFFRQQARMVRPGGKLVLIDDVQSDGVDRSAISNRERLWLERYEYGWHARSFVPHATVVANAGAAGFRLIRDENLRPLLRLGRPRDRFLALFVTPFAPLIGRHPYGRSLVGGNALQHALEQGSIEYRLMVFERDVACG